MKFLILFGLFISSSSFAETKTTCPGHLSDGDCKKQCSGYGRTYESSSRICTNPNGLKDFRGRVKGTLPKERASSFSR